MRFWPPDELRRVVLFAAVGVVNTLLSLAVYATLLALQAGYLAAAPIAFAAGALNGYLLNARFTFRRPRSRSSLLRYVLAQSAAAAAADVMLWALVAATREKLAAYALTLVVVAAGSFLASRLWVFAAVG
jgi:putative flippase GtrA